MTRDPSAVKAAGARFRVPGELAAVAPWGQGHINDTFLATYRDGGREARYIHQRVNLSVFKTPAAMMNNVLRVTEHIRNKVALGAAEISGLKPLTLVPTREGYPYWQDESGFWRTFEFIEGARTLESIETPAQATEAARAFGEFQRLLGDLGPPRIEETISDFHDTPKRFEAFERALSADSHDRAREAAPEIAFAVARRSLAGILTGLRAAGRIPERVVHNDTKINNVLFDEATGRGVCVIDLDTVMPGIALYDFGDLVRSSVSPAAEDERDLSRVALRMPIFEALATGYLAATAGFLNEVERDNLVASVKVIALELGLRFLTDFLSGDAYFKTSRPGQNLDRCRTQFRLLELIEAREDELERLIARI